LRETIPRMESGAAPVQFRQRGAAPLMVRFRSYIEVGLGRGCTR